KGHAGRTDGQFGLNDRADRAAKFARMSPSKKVTTIRPLFSKVDHWTMLESPPSGYKVLHNGCLRSGKTSRWVQEVVKSKFFDKRRCSSATTVLRCEYFEPSVSWQALKKPYPRKEKFMFILQCLSNALWTRVRS